MFCLKAHAKINWTLDITGRRDDGYHLMDMLMQSVALHDTLWFEECDELRLESAAVSSSENIGRDAFSSSAVTYDQSNLVYRAALLLKQIYKVEKGALIRLKKTIPSGAGMGGGSADAAAALLGLNQLWNLRLPSDILFSLGLKLGADVPFMLAGGCARVQGIGEKLSPFEAQAPVYLVMLQPCGGLSTKEVFGAFDAMNPSAVAHPQTEKAMQALVDGNLSLLGDSMGNVLEAVSKSVRGAIAQSIEALENCGAIRAMMTGSGSVVYGVCKDEAHSKIVQQKMQAISLSNGWGDVQTTHTLSKKDLQSNPKTIIL